VSTSRPPREATASRRIKRWASSTAPYRSPRRLSSAVEPSMSVNRKVTVPRGSSATRYAYAFDQAMSRRRLRKARSGQTPKNGPALPAHTSLGRVLAGQMSAGERQVHAAGESMRPDLGPTPGAREAHRAQGRDVLLPPTERRRAHHRLTTRHRSPHQVRAGAATACYASRRSNVIDPVGLAPCWVQVGSLLSSCWAPG
jgi:hypothetical protein